MPQLSTASSAGSPPYTSTPALMRLIAAGAASADLVDFSAFNMQDANMLMRLSCVFNIWGNVAMALEVQARALTLRQLYSLPPKSPAGPRLLAIMKPGYMKDNTPLEFLLEDADIAVDMLYVSPELPLPAALPEHDLVFVAIAHTAANEPLLAQVRGLLARSDRPVLNLPAPGAHLERDRVSALLAGVAGMETPASLYLDRAQLLAIADGAVTMAHSLPDGDFPVIVRPAGSQAGLGLEKIGDLAALRAYVEARAETLFCVSRFVDYVSPDGQYRKCRVALIKGQPYICHYAISPHWMVHYQSAGMAHNADKRAEEAEVMAQDDRGFCARHRAALQAIATRLACDYLVIDCAETADGALLFFEADNIAIAHAMDNEDLFPYKKRQMRKVFEAFQAMLLDAARRAP
jgi:hypothetical protein